MIIFFEGCTTQSVTNINKIETLTSEKYYMSILQLHPLLALNYFSSMFQIGEIDWCSKKNHWSKDWILHNPRLCLFLSQRKFLASSFNYIECFALYTQIRTTILRHNQTIIFRLLTKRVFFFLWIGVVCDSEMNKPLFTTSKRL